MCDEQRKIQRTPFEPSEERLAEPTQTGACVQDDDVAAAADLDTRGVAAIAEGARPRRGYRAANAPKLDMRGGFDGGNLTQPRTKMKFKKRREDRESSRITNER
jgi:hypothetical protein